LRYSFYVYTKRSFSSLQKTKSFLQILGGFVRVKIFQGIQIVLGHLGARLKTCRFDSFYLISSVCVLFMLSHYNLRLSILLSVSILPYWESLKMAGPGRSWPILAGPRKNKVSKLFQKIFFFNFEAKHTKGLKPFRANSGYRNLLGVRGSPFTEEKVWWTGRDRPGPAKIGQDRPFSVPRPYLSRKQVNPLFTDSADNSKWGKKDLFLR